MRWLLALVVLLVQASGQTPPADLLRKSSALADRRVTDPAQWKQIFKAAPRRSWGSHLVHLGRVGGAEPALVAMEVLQDLSPRELASHSSSIALMAGELDVGSYEQWSQLIPHDDDLAWLAGQLSQPGDIPFPKKVTTAWFLNGGRSLGGKLTQAALDVVEKTRGSQAMQRAAAWHLSRFAKSQDIEGLLRCVRSGGPRISAWVASALGRTKDKRAVAPLVAMGLGSSDRAVQINVLRALRKIPAAATIPVAVNCLRSDDPHRMREALLTLASLGKSGVLSTRDERGLTTFVFAILDRDPRPNVRAAALKAYAALDPKNFRNYAADARLASHYRVRAAFASALENGGRADMLLLRRFLSDPDRRVVIAAVETLSKLRTDESTAMLLATAQANPDGVVRAVVLSALTERVKPGSPLAKKSKVLARECVSSMPAHEVEQRLAAVALAGKLRHKELLLQLAKSDTEVSVREHARAALKEMGTSSIPPRKPLPDGAVSGVGVDQQVRVRVHTNRGDLDLTLDPKAAPRTVQSFLALAKAGFYDGVLFHRVVSDFVVQAGCPRGDGWGGPDRTIRCEINRLPYKRGTLGMALAGKDTGGSQWFICHSAQPHLQGRYTVFGKLSRGWKVLDALEQDDYILRVSILAND